MKEADYRDSLQTIDHSSGDVAYLRITAHIENKIARGKLQNYSRRPLLDEEFQRVYETTKDIPRPLSVEKGEVGEENECLGPPRLVEIGDGVYATDSIGVSSSSSVEADIRGCIDQLICKTYQITLDDSLTVRQTYDNSTYYLRHFATQKHVRLFTDQLYIC